MVSVFAGVGIWGIVTRVKAVKEITKAAKNDDVEKYFEGEDDFETFKKEHPIKTSNLD